MINKLIASLLLTLTCGTSGSGLYAQEIDPEIDGTVRIPPPITADSVRRFFDTAFKVQQLDHKMVGSIVSVVYRGEVLFKTGYGWADLEQRVAADADRSLFRIASITKLFVWTAIMQLYEAGRLDLEDDVNSHLDFEIPQTFPEPIRIKHLMTHTPGFEERNVGSSSRSIADVVPLDQYLRSAIPMRVRPPGEHASYSNYGTALAGYIIERITGQSWSDYVDENILIPLDMSSTNTHVPLPEKFQRRHAVSYQYSAGQFTSMPYTYFLDLPAGHMSTTADDMTRFMLAHLHEGKYQDTRILSAATTRKMHTPLFAPHKGIAPMLHGFYRSDRNGLLIFGHGGDVNQFHSNLTLIPSKGLGIFVSFNSDPSSTARSNLVAAFINHFFPTEYLRVPEATVEINLEDYVGEYLPLRRNVSTFERLSMLVDNLTITAQGSELVVGASGPSRWLPVAADRFTAKYTDATLVFERDSTGAVSHMVVVSPLSTYQRVSGLDAPSNIRSALIFTVLIALLAVLGYGYRAFRRAPNATRLPPLDVALAWVYASLLLGVYIQLALVLSGNVDEFAYGVPTSAHITLILTNINLLLGVAVLILSIRQWARRAGGVAARLRYSAVSLTVIVTGWIAYYFNFIAYVF